MFWLFMVKLFTLVTSLLFSPIFANIYNLGRSYMLFVNVHANIKNCMQNIKILNYQNVSFVVLLNNVCDSLWKYLFFNANI